MTMRFRTTNPKIFPSWLVLFLLVLVFCNRKQDLDQEKIQSLLIHRSLGLAYLEENRLKEAETEFQQLIAIAPQEALGHANLALTYLRMARYEEGEKQARKALELSNEPETSLILADILERSGNLDASKGVLQRSVQSFPRHVPSQYKLAQLNYRIATSNRYREMEQNLEAVLVASPANLPAKLQFVEVLVRNRKPKEAIAHLRETRQMIPELPADSEKYWSDALNSLTASNSEEALPQVIAFHNLLKPTPLYQAGIQEVSGAEGPLMGQPLLHFSSKISAEVSSRPLEHIRFVRQEEQVAASINPTADYDHDGKMESIHFRENSLSLVDQNQKVLQEVPGNFSGAVFLDLDQDGDLDLYTIGEARAFQNTGNTFVDRTDAMNLQHAGRSSDASFGDFDDDGDVDLIVADPVKGNLLYDNLRQGRFEEVSRKRGLTGSSHSVAVEDYDADGFVDVFVTGEQSILFRNRGDGTFEQDNRSRLINERKGKDAAFTDFDNDGYRDLILVGQGTYLLRNDGTGVFQDASSVLPKSLPNFERVVTKDHDSDGDLDLFVLDSAKKIHVLKNDGGNANRWLKVQLAGLGTGSGKNNLNGIGAKLEVKAGNLYQLRYVQEAVTHFGLGQRANADVLRIVWTNGVPQNHIQPQSNQIVLEKQILKGSCPFVYAWNGERFEFVTDIMWKSALGMPLGIMAGSTAYAFPNSSDEYLRIDGSKLKAKDGFYTLQITEELWETAYLDQSRLIAVDHPDTVEIYIDEKFVIPPFPPLRIYPVFEKIYPLSVKDQHGLDLRQKILSRDDEYISNLKSANYQGTTQEHDLILDFGRGKPTDELMLFLTGWIFPSDASINVATAQMSGFKTIAPYLQVPDQNGKWQTVIPSISFPMGKDKTMIVDLSGKFLTDDHRVRIRTTMEIYWDEIFYTKNEPSIPIRTTTLKPSSADLHYRGFSRMYRKSILGPHWFDYSNVEETPRWRDLEGNYTRFGDVKPLLEESDSRYVIMNAGDEITIRFDANQPPPVPRRWTRDFLLYSDGWIKDGDLNTAHSKTVEPLPFHGIRSYPYSPGEQYPTDRAHQDYLKAYNTRTVKPNLRLDP
jgi:tetratricopeptide (TPR) repeat protein